MILWQSIHLNCLTKSIDKHESKSKGVGKIYLNMHIKNEACSTVTESDNYFRSGIIKGNLCKKVIWFKRLRLKVYLGLKSINTVSCNLNSFDMKMSKPSKRTQKRIKLMPFQHKHTFTKPPTPYYKTHNRINRSWKTVKSKIQWSVMNLCNKIDKHITRAWISNSEIQWLVNMKVKKNSSP